MDSEERKRKFVILLEELLKSHCDGIQARLADKLEITASRISRWLSGQVDPINLETSVFSRVASVKGSSSEELAVFLGFNLFNKNSPNKFKVIVEQILSDKTQEQLGEILGITQNAISNWLNPEKTIDPGKIPAVTMFTIAHEKGWTFDDLLIYLGLKEYKVENNLLIKYQSQFPSLSLNEQVILLNSLSDLILEKVTQQKAIEKIVTHGSERKVCVVIEEEDVLTISSYSSNLAFYFQLNPENITISTPRSLPDSLSIFDVLLFDLNNQQSPCIPLIESLEFDGDVVALVDRSLPDDLCDRLKQKATEVIVKPVPWSELKQKAYFS